ncbi:hypothetical protein HGRIS_002354 [Hohenbuehelia grisea]|uniref:YCII-related domain-containing protein n=1 Tax=Hohenbuehelia grisea TaxID=104357 RepID=A0ABR3JKZ1_9AGAR
MLRPLTRSLSVCKHVPSSTVVFSRSLSNASASPKLHHFMIYAPDCTDSSAVERRFSVRPKHLEGVAPLIANRTIKVAGMFVTPESILPGATTKTPKGSLLIVEAETIDDVHKMIKNDIYYTSKAWDPEQLVILPFLPVTPLDK